MCGIIGYTGPLAAKNVLLNGLSQLEYRGYDSAGIAFFGADQEVHVLKTVGKVARLRDLCAEVQEEIHCGIGHTRWATHGGVTAENAHPHQAGRVTMIHNGIIENYHQLTADFELEGKLISQTDTEVAARVLDALYDGDPLASLRRFQPLLKGSYSFCILFSDHPG